MPLIQRNGPCSLSSIGVVFDRQQHEYVLTNQQTNSLMGSMPDCNTRMAQARYIQEFGQDCFKAGYRQALVDVRHSLAVGNPESLQ